MFLSRPINGGFILGFYSRPRKQLFKFYGNGPDNIVKNRFQTFSVSTLKRKHRAIRGHRKLDGQTGFPIITKCHFFQDNQVSS